MSDPIYPPSSDIASGAHISSMEQYRDLYEQSIANPAKYWDREAASISFFHPYDVVVEQDLRSATFSWFRGAQLNVSYNCIDRHLPERAEQTAIIWAADEPGEYHHITYQELQDNVCRIANVLRHRGVRKGDRVCLYLPMIPELAYTMLACSRIGAIHSVVFAGFSAIGPA